MICNNGHHLKVIEMTPYWVCELAGHLCMSENRRGEIATNYDESVQEFNL